MNLEFIREAGLGGSAALGLGALGLLLGCFAILALVAGNRSAFSLGVATLVIGTATAGAGMLGTVYGRHQVKRAIASVGSSLDMERILRLGFREAQASSWLGFFAALVPLALGGAAVLLGARLQRPRARIQGFAEPSVSSDEGTGQSVIGGVFLCITALACGGAWAMAHSELPKVRYSFADDDLDGWQLAGALDELKTRGPGACGRLSDALQRFWGADDKREWPRKMRGTVSPELSEWRAAADGCAAQVLQSLDDGSLEPPWTHSGLLDSPLLQDEALHTRALAWTSKSPAAEAPLEDQPQGVRELLLKAIRREQPAMRACYERELVKTPRLNGKLQVDLVIIPPGRVRSAVESPESNFPNRKVAACVLERFRAIQFTGYAGDEDLRVRFPLVFKPAE